MTLTCCLQTFPISLRDPNTMEILGYTATETLLWDYSETEGYFVLAKPPDISVQTLFSVPVKYAYQWFGLNGANGLKLVYYPFSQINFKNLTDPCDCPPAPVLSCPDPGPGFATIVNADNACLLNANNNCITAKT